MNAAVPHIVCWPRLGLARPQTLAALAQLDGIRLTVVETLPDLLAVLAGADALVLHSAPLAQAQAVVDRLVPGGRLRWMHFLTAGRDAFETAGLPPTMQVTHVSGASAPAVAEHAMALLLALCRRLPAALEFAGQRRWDRAAMGRFVSLEGKTVGVIGAGAIGREVARRLRAFGARAVGVTRSGADQPGFDEMQAAARLHTVLPRCDAVVLAVPLTAVTRHLIDAAALAALPKGAFVVNVARGAVIDQAALCEALHSGHLGGAGLDVTEPEPPWHDDPIWSCPNLIVSPHVAVEGSGATAQRIAAGTAENVRRFVRGEPLLDLAVR